ncbi:MAG: 4-(cytidine 5'-diphospho)-2-C-methyl-D-erythritol kinase, partial [Acidimicrobiales bacterium]
DLDVAARLGADVPFCVLGGRARVRGIGEQVELLPHQERQFLLLLPPLAVDTASVYRAWDLGHRCPHRDDAGNDLEAAAINVEPRLARWRDAFASATGVRPRLAGSGAAWFVEGEPGVLGWRGGEMLEVDGARAAVVLTRAVPGSASDAPLPPEGAGA